MDSICMIFRRDGTLQKNFLISDFTTVLLRMAVRRNYDEAIGLSLRPLRYGTLKKRSVNHVLKFTFPSRRVYIIQVAIPMEQIKRKD